MAFCPRFMQRTAAIPVFSSSRLICPDTTAPGPLLTGPTVRPYCGITQTTASISRYGQKTKKANSEFNCLLSAHTVYLRVSKDVSDQQTET